jgi:hypothetical protein
MWKGRKAGISNLIHYNISKLTKSIFSLELLQNHLLISLMNNTVRMFHINNVSLFNPSLLQIDISYNRDDSSNIPTCYTNDYALIFN